MNKLTDETKNILKKAGEKAAAAEKKLEEEAAIVGHAAVEAVYEVEEIIVRTERRVMSMARDFFRLEASGGIFLVMAATLAMIIANSPLYHYYHHILDEIDFSIGFSDVNVGFETLIKKPILLWINDGLMAIFFFLVGLEIKREILAGELSSREKVILPVFAAIGGMAIPAAIFWFFNRDNPAGLDGWAVPAATDIAFALGVISLLGPRVPVSLKVLLTAIAIIDDIGAILIIAFFYAHDVTLGPLWLALAALVVLMALNRRHVMDITPYILTAVILWVAVLESGIHATLAGVVAAMFIPMRNPHNPHYSPLKRLQHALHPWVAFLVLPLFAFANAGVPFHGMMLHEIANPVTLGIILGLFIGKQVGIFSTLAFAIKCGLCPKPRGTSWLQLYAVSVLCGIGFTMSLFIGALAYSSADMQVSVRVGVVIGSLLSAFAGYLLLYYGTGKETSDSSSQASSGKQASS